MSYHAFIPVLKKFVFDLQRPRVLEIGNDRGSTFVPLAVFMLRTKDSFHLMGIDVMLQESLLITIAHIDRNQSQRIDLVQANSLETLPKLAEAGAKFDVVLLDGDHNYHTVTRELLMLDALVEDHTLLVVDDYNGRWAERDLFYSERKEYSGCKEATLRIKTDKHGVRAAVDDFLTSTSAWTMLFKDDNVDFVVLRRKRQSDNEAIHSRRMPTSSRYSSVDLNHRASL